MYLRRATNCDCRNVLVFVNTMSIWTASSSSLIDLSSSLSSPSHPSASSAGYYPCRNFTFRMVLQAREDQFSAIEVADRLYVSDTTKNRDFIISTVLNQSVSMDLTAHDGQHKAVVASIVAQPQLQCGALQRPCTRVCQEPQGGQL